MITRHCDIETIADFSRYYNSSYVGWHGKKDAEVTPMYVGTYVEDKILVKFITSVKNNTPSMTDWESHTLEELKENIDFGRPKVGIMRDGPTIVFLSQSTPREGHKGLRIRDIRIHTFNSYDIQNKYSSTYVGERFDWIWESFNPKYEPIGSAFSKLNAGAQVGAALSKDIGIYTQPTYLYPLICYKRWTIGYAKNEELIFIHPFFADYETELRNKTGVEVKIV